MSGIGNKHLLYLWMNLKSSTTNTTQLTYTSANLPSILCIIWQLKSHALVLEFAHHRTMEQMIGNLGEEVKQHSKGLISCTKMKLILCQNKCGWFYIAM